MKRKAICVVVAATVVAACSERGGTATEPDLLTVPLYSQHAGGQHEDRNFRSHARGSEEVPANDSRAVGQAVFQFSRDGTELKYRLIVANIQNVTQAHIHLAPAGQNGPVVLWLYPSAPPAMLIPGRSQGVLGEGTVTAANLVGQLAGQPLSALRDRILAGNAYVNVHTSQFPPGEIRGQIH
ncbi:MAG TPA: CHRD domain-containing protein [Longimicrobiales bacterium]|nr:CHRD domain-containing protein [Longimicrobiales bacterium]